MTDVSIIIVNFHSEELIKKCIESIYNKTSGIGYEIIIVDNETSQESQKKLNPLCGSNVRLIRSEINLGFGKANNLGAESANGKYLFLLNPDTELITNAVKELFDYIEVNNNVGVVGGNLYSPADTPLPSFCKKFDTIRDEVKNANWTGIIFDKVKTILSFKKQFSDTFNYSVKPLNVAYIFGADMFLEKKLFDQLGGFDKDFFMYSEEEDLQFRINQLGYLIVNIPWVRIMHLEGATSGSAGGLNERQFRMRMNGKMTFYEKRGGLKAVKQFYEMRIKKYKNLLKWQKLKGKDIAKSNLFKSMKILENVYKEYMNGKEHK